MLSAFSLAPWLRKHPLLVLAVPAAAGIIIADNQAWRPGWLLAVVTLLVWLPVLRRPGVWIAAPGMLLLFGFLHSLRLADTFAHPLRAELLAGRGPSPQVQIRGQLFPWAEGAELDETSVLCEVSELSRGRSGVFQPVKARIKVRLPEGQTLKTPGLYELRGLLSLPRKPMNPGQFDAMNYGLRMGWIAVLKAQEMSLVEPDKFAPRFHLLHAAESCRQWITRQLSQGLEKEGDHAAVILAMALGASDAAGEDIEDAFRDSGTLHVFAVSGLHVVMLAHIASFCLRWLGTQRMNVLLIVIVFAYAFITGWRPSAARAAFMLAIVLAAPLLHRQPQSANTLGAAALVLLLFDTHQLFLPGFQLSFGVLLAILLCASFLVNQVRPWCELDPFLPPVLATRAQRFGVWARTFAAALVCVSVAAWAGSLPFTIAHFQTVSAVAVISNLFLVPASEGCLILSCASLLLAACKWGWAVMAVNHLNVWLAKWMVVLATWFAGLPGASHTLDMHFQKEAPPAEMRILHVPFGGGAGYLRSGDQRWLLDTGNVNNWRHVLRPFLRHDGINHLDGLILSHADISHVGAVPHVLAAQGVPHIHTSNLEPWRLDPPFASLKKLSQTVQPDGPVWQRHRIDDVITLAEGGEIPVTAQVLHPSGTDLHEKADDRSLVLLIRAGPFRILWLNDAGFVTEKRLLERRAPVRCDILVRHQHSADFSGLTELLLAAQPQAVISSNDAYRTQELLPQRVRDFCQSARIPLFDLEADGGVGIEFRPAEAVLKAHLSGQTVILHPRLENH